MRAEWFAERVDENVATASTSVPAAVASDAIVAVSATSLPRYEGRSVFSSRTLSRRILRRLSSSNALSSAT